MVWLQAHHVGHELPLRHAHSAESLGVGSSRKRRQVVMRMPTRLEPLAFEPHDPDSEAVQFGQALGADQVHAVGQDQSGRFFTGQSAILRANSCISASIPPGSNPASSSSSA